METILSPRENLWKQLATVAFMETVGNARLSPSLALPTSFNNNNNNNNNNNGTKINHYVLYTNNSSTDLIWGFVPVEWLFYQ